MDQLGRLDIIVANAGIGTAGAKLHKMGEDLWQEMIDVNLSGVWKTVKACVPHIKAGGRGGSIILTSSVAGLKTYPHTGHYVTAKHGVVGVMRTFAAELGQDSIRVNSVHPTHVNTPLLMNEKTYRMFRPELDNPGPTTSHRSAGRFICCRFRGWKRWTSATPFYSSPQTNPVTSQVSHFPSTPAAA